MSTSSAWPADLAVLRRLLAEDNLTATDTYAAIEAPESPGRPLGQPPESGNRRLRLRRRPAKPWTPSSKPNRRCATTSIAGILIAPPELAGRKRRAGQRQAALR